MTRRAFLATAGVIGAGMLSACTGAPPSDQGRVESGSEPRRTDGAGSVAAGDRFGVGLYNTQEVADELLYIEGAVEPIAEEERKRILVTGSTGGLGQLAAAHLLARGHRVVAHARNEQRAADVRRDLPGLEGVVVGDFALLDQTEALAEQINGLGAFDVIVHNAAVYGEPGDITAAVNTLSPYLLTCLVAPPRQLVYLTSDLHLGGDPKAEELRSGGTAITYDDSKLHMAMLAAAVARLRPDLQVNAVAPGWVPTMMGFHNGPYAPDPLREGYMTQVLLAEGEGSWATVSGEFLFHREVESRVHDAVHDPAAQDELLAALSERTGLSVPAA